MKKQRDILDIHIGQRVREGRELKGWSRKEFAEKLGCEPLHVTQCEQGKLLLTPRRLLLLALTLEITVDDLFPKTLVWGHSETEEG